MLLYLLDEVSEGIRPLGGASRWWLHGSLRRARARLAALGGRLVLRRGAAEQVLPDLVRETGAGAVFWNRRYGASREIDARLKAAPARRRTRGAELRRQPARRAVDGHDRAGHAVPGVHAVLAGGPAAADARAAARAAASSPGTPDRRRRPRRLGAAADPARLGGGAPRDVDAGRGTSRTPPRALRREHPAPTTTGATSPPVDVTSRLSPHLRFGELSPRRSGTGCTATLDARGRRNAPKFLSELGWREFNRNILFHEPDLATANHRPAVRRVPVERARPRRAARLAAAAAPASRWSMPACASSGTPATCTTGCGWSSASFLIKNLLVDWRVGEQWFWDTLVDADEASNPGNWQWVAGSGADAAPYFRVFNPELQATKFDPDGEYLRRWVPELRHRRLPRADRRPRRDAARGARGLRARRRRHAGQIGGRPPITMIGARRDERRRPRRRRPRPGRVTQRSRNPAASASPAPVGSTMCWIVGAGTARALLALERR